MSDVLEGLHARPEHPPLSPLAWDRTLSHYSALKPSTRKAAQPVTGLRLPRQFALLLGDEQKAQNCRPVRCQSLS
jgi:hypothetical protein